MARVFVTQLPNRFDSATRALVPSVNIAPATEFGEIVVMFPPRAPFFHTSELLKQLALHLENYDFDGGDCIVLLGDTTLMAAASAYLGKRFGKFKLLRWDRNLGRYTPIVVKI